jgi:hypothetical protein
MLSYIHLAVTFLALMPITNAAADRPAIIFVPGAFHRAKVYDQVISHLTPSGYDHLEAIDLPSVGQVVGRDRDIEAVRAAIVEQIDAGRDVLLVGNSTFLSTMSR